MSKLDKYSKQEIILAIKKLSNYWRADLEDRLIDMIQDNIREKAFQSARSARQNALDCMNKYFNWQKQMIAKYGKDGKCKLVDIPPYELAEGVRLQKLWNKAEAEREKLENIEDSYYTE